MRNLIKILIFGSIIGLLNIGCKSTNNSNGNLFDFNNVDKSLIETSPGVKISSSGTNDKKSLIFEINEESTPVPYVLFKEGANYWNLSKYKYLAADISNKGSKDVLVELRPLNLGWLGGGQIIPAGETRTVRSFIQRIDEYPEYLNEKFIGMDALPGDIIKSFWWCAVSLDSINSISIAVIDPYPDISLLITNLRGEGTITPPTEMELNDNYFPIIDEFGQFSKKEWPSKIHSVNDLISSKDNELKDIELNPRVEDWNKYGGWTSGPLLKSSGHFRTEKINGKWWFIDPEGRLFWSHGISSVNFNGSTPLNDRAHFFEILPDTSQYSNLYSSSTRNVPKGYYKGLRTIESFNFFGWNLLRKYGDNWENEYPELTHARLSSWGMNSLGNFSAPSITNLSKTPYTGGLSSNAGLRIEASEGAWTKFPDPFDNSFVESIRNSYTRINQSNKDPYCIGYFVDNELFWGNNTYLSEAIIQSGSTQPAKIATLDFLKKRYENIEDLNVIWGTSYKEWNDFLESRIVPSKEIKDLNDISELVATKYFTTVKETLNQLAPGKLYLGCRFDFHYYPSEDVSEDWVVNIASKFCDVVSFNRYRYSAGDLKPSTADKPVIVGEWHMGALDSGMLHFSLRHSEDQVNRAEMYDYYVKSCLNNPYIVGSHWFQYIDQPVLGRADGEGLNAGFVDYGDVPYPEMIKTSRNIGKNMYSIRYQ